MTDMFQSHAFIERLGRDLAEAVARQDAVRYAMACDELGRTPEFPELYERGQLEIEIEYRRFPFILGAGMYPKIEDPNLNKYRNFYEKGNRLSSSFEKDIIEKRRLLETRFPGRFGKNGKQPIKNLDDLQAGCVFNNLLKYAERRIKTAS